MITPHKCFFIRINSRGIEKLNGRNETKKKKEKIMDVYFSDLEVGN